MNDGYMVTPSQWWFSRILPSGKVTVCFRQIADVWFPQKMVMFSSYVNVYQRYADLSDGMFDQILTSWMGSCFRMMKKLRCPVDSTKQFLGSQARHWRGKKSPWNQWPPAIFDETIWKWREKIQFMICLGVQCWHVNLLERQEIARKHVVNPMIQAWLLP